MRRRGEIYSFFLVVFSYFSRHLGGGVGVGKEKDSSYSPCQTKPLFGIFSSSSFFSCVGSCSCVDLLRRRKGGENLPWVHCACVCVHKKEPTFEGRGRRGGDASRIILDFFWRGKFLWENSSSPCCIFCNGGTPEHFFCGIATKLFLNCLLLQGGNPPKEDCKRYVWGRHDMTSKSRFP